MLDNALLALVRKELYTAAVGDILDRMGHRIHFLPPPIRPLDPSMVVVGRAMPVIVEDGAVPEDEEPFGRMLEALDSLGEGDVYITNGGASQYALWGELMSTRATQLKAAGVVMNGYHRDSPGILDIAFPTFSWGGWALDIRYRGRVTNFNVPAVVGGVPVRPADIVFGDRDGVLVVPQELADEAFARALEKVHSENLVRKGLREGLSAVEAWRKYKVM